MVVANAVGKVLEIIIVVGEAKKTIFPVFVAISYDLEARIVRLEESTTTLTKGVVCSLMMVPIISVLRLLPIILKEGNVHGVVSMRLAIPWNKMFLEEEKKNKMFSWRF